MTILLYDLVGRDTARPFSPHCWKVAFALAHKELEFERVPTGFTEVPRVEGGVSKTVPVIRDGEQVVTDSFAIAVYLEETYPDRPTLFDGAGGLAAARFVERWAAATLHPPIAQAALKDIHDALAPEDQSYFRESREARMGRPLEQVWPGEAALREAFAAALLPLRSMLKAQPFIGGEGPLFSDYIVAGALQWLRVVSPFWPLEVDDRVDVWFQRCLDLHGGVGRAVPAAA
ncbi:glutathione S-transferase family protein [Aquibium sp. A9E412]|uniref:glutathione S-transferase family protein n=1 Tax=Aquibium sp. A9E412 TaxID=2976767 RepID=UPI0025AFC081|nr:glutathione S-transferase family protein [Aquibium sp. A9E412]MDN2565011.1 glutathione S-transferase family protein [Aquibium sp. A9E412]